MGRSVYRVATARTAATERTVLLSINGCDCAMPLMDSRTRVEWTIVYSRLDASVG